MVEFLLSVHCDDSDWIGKAKDILKNAGAEDIASAGEKAVRTHGVDTPERVRTSRTSSAVADSDLSKLEDRNTSDLGAKTRY
jgi:hypothetical protein